MTLVEAAHNSVGVKDGNCARIEFRLLLEDFRTLLNVEDSVRYEKLAAVERIEKTEKPFKKVEDIFSCTLQTCKSHEFKRIDADFG